MDGFDAWNVFVCIFEDFKKSTLKFNLSRGFRAANISEIASNGRHEGTLRFEYGTPELKPELSHQIDLAYFINSDHVTFEFTPFSNLISNYIFLKLSNPRKPQKALEFLVWH